MADVNITYSSANYPKRGLIARFARFLRAQLQKINRQLYNLGYGEYSSNEFTTPIGIAVEGDDGEVLLQVGGMVVVPKRYVEWDDGN